MNHETTTNNRITWRFLMHRSLDTKTASWLADWLWLTSPRQGPKSTGAAGGGVRSFVQVCEGQGMNSKNTESKVYGIRCTPRKIGKVRYHRDDQRRSLCDGVDKKLYSEKYCFELFLYWFYRRVVCVYVSGSKYGRRHAWEKLAPVYLWWMCATLVKIYTTIFVVGCVSSKLKVTTPRRQRTPHRYLCAFTVY